MVITRDHAMLNLAVEYVPPIYKRILAAVERRSKTSRELAKTCNTTQTNMHTRIKVLHQKLRVIYIAKWVENEHGNFAACYRLGNNADAPAPQSARPTVGRRVRGIEHQPRIGVWGL